MYTRTPLLFHNLFLSFRKITPFHIHWHTDPPLVLCCAVFMFGWLSWVNKCMLVNSCPLPYCSPSPVYSLVKLGARFSTKAVMPSLRSFVENVAWKWRRSNLSPSFRVVS